LAVTATTTIDGGLGNDTIDGGDGDDFIEVVRWKTAFLVADATTRDLAEAGQRYRRRLVTRDDSIKRLCRATTVLSVAKVTIPIDGAKITTHLWRWRDGQHPWRVGDDSLIVVKVMTPLSQAAGDDIHRGRVQA